MSSEPQPTFRFRQAVVAGLTNRHLELGLKVPEYPVAATGEGVSVDRGRLASLARVEAFHRERMEEVLAIGSEVGIAKPAPQAAADELMASFYRVMGRRDALVSLNDQLHSLHEFGYDMAQSRDADPKVLDRLQQALAGSKSDSSSTLKGLRSGLLPAELEASCATAVDQGWAEIHEELRQLADSGHEAQRSGDGNSTAAWGGSVRLALATHAEFLAGLDGNTDKVVADKAQAAQQWWVTAQARRILQATLTNLAVVDRPDLEVALRSAPASARQQQPTQYWALVEQVMLAREDLQVPSDDQRPLGRPLFRRPPTGTTYVNPRTGVQAAGEDVIEVSTGAVPSSDEVAKALLQAQHEVLITDRLDDLAESLAGTPSHADSKVRSGASLSQ